MVRIVEFHDKTQEDKLPFDVVDDVHFHMIDDDAFYRKYYMPCMDKVDKLKDKSKIEQYVKPMIHKCINHYCMKYDLNKTPEDLLTNEERSDLYTRVLEYYKNPPEDMDAPKTTI